jgi:hypothetical protein
MKHFALYLLLLTFCVIGCICKCSAQSKDTVRAIIGSRDLQTKQFSQCAGYIVASSKDTSYLYPNKTEIPKQTIYYFILNNKTTWVRKP